MEPRHPDALSSAGGRRWLVAGRMHPAILVLVLALLVCLVVAGWTLGSRTYPLEAGRPFDKSTSIDVAEAMRADGTENGPRIVIRGQIGEVCRSAGCWFVVQSSREGRLHQVMVDLKKSGGLAVPDDASGREVTVAGRLVRSPPNITFAADGFLIK